mmetsp:Transcript_53099/g.113393  ORF Transcript_53099/g.113393 Transcript_53099/m.113393 type:complete len:115 (+) Transcript_53099:47-391(+)
MSADTGAVRQRRSGSGSARWTCQLCSQSRNEDDSTSCMTCGRPRGHIPEKYQSRLKEIRSTGDDDYDPEEEFRWSDAWGLICGIILLLVIVALLVWAYFEDQKELRMLSENQEL